MEYGILVLEGTKKIEIGIGLATGIMQDNFQEKVHNQWGVANGDFGVTTRAINGGLECDSWNGRTIARQRYEMYGRVRAAFGLPGPGNERGCYN